MKFSPCRIFISLLLFCPILGDASEGSDTGVKADWLGSRPNVLFLFADDLTYLAVGERGKVDIDTPNIDRLAAEGTSFTRAYNMGGWSGAICVASRTMMITGRSLWDAHQTAPELDREAERKALWPQLMKQAGYRTFFTGKWHVSTDVSRIFDQALHVRGGMPKTIGGYHRPIEGQPDDWDPADQSLKGFWEGGKHWSEVTADDAITFLDEGQGADDPFFMYVAFNAPHDPRQSPQSFLDRYPLERIEVPEPFMESYPYKEAMGAGPDLRDEALAPFPRTEYAVKVHTREYFALITHLDEQIGRVLEALERSGERENTWIFFTADHGLSVGRHGLLGKQSMYDHSLRVPFLVVGPGVSAGAKREAPIYLQDIMPTTLQLAGVEIPRSVYYHSLLPQVEGDLEGSNYPQIVGAYRDTQRALIDQGWKLIVYPEAETVRLYHTEEDPYEKVDLAEDPRYQKRTADLFEKLVAEQEALGDPLDLSKIFSHIISVDES